LPHQKKYFLLLQRISTFKYGIKQESYPTTSEFTASTPALQYARALMLQRKIIFIIKTGYATYVIIAL
jgi:hypothetical protein